MIPRDIKQQIDAYIDDGFPPGSFLYACLTNNLRLTVEKPDDINKEYISDIMGYLFNYAPVGCWGTTDSVKWWLREHRENPNNLQANIGWDKDRRKWYYDKMNQDENNVWL